MMPPTRPALLLTAILSLAAGAARPAEWVKLRDPHGFEVDLPAGWGARVLATGQVVFSPEPETLLGPQCSVWTLHLKRPKPAAEVARALVRSYKAVFADMTAEGPHQLKGRLADSCSMRGGLAVLGKPWKYVLVVSSRGRVAVSTGFAAPAEQSDRLKPVFARILAGFRRNGKLRDPRRIAPPASKWVKWTDPKEGAFSLMLPKGWKVDEKVSGLVRPYIDACGWFSAKKGGRDSCAVSMYNFAPPLYVEPNQMLLSCGFREGAAYNPAGGVGANMIVMRYLGAEGYVRNIYFPNVKKAYPDAKLEGVLPRPDLARGRPNNRWIPIQYDGAEGRVSGTVDDVKVKGRAYVLASRVMVQGSPVRLWNATVETVCAPPAEFEQAYDVFWRIKDSVRVDPRWAVREARAQVKRSQIIANAADDVADMMHRSYESRSRAMDEIARKWSNATMGQTDLVDPSTGEVRYGVPSGSNYYWKVGGDVVVGTETHTPPAIDAEELQNLDDLRRG